ncbi:MAG: hypothetical protein HOI95_00005, partial [Chromatiales bacterium]|nr:hypothetical protein [Chromatiales bacterium]
MTILTGAKPATKTLGLDANGVLVVTEGYDPQQTVFSYSQRDVPNIRALARVLEEVSLTPEAFAIRGALREHVDPEQRVFRRVDVNRWGLEAHFEECPRRWEVIDIDKKPLDNIDLVNDPAGTVKRAIQRYLPACYHNASFVWQLSSSAGVGDDDGGLLSIHIWFLFDRAVGFNELKTFHELQAPEVDTAVFRTVQVHFVAAPKFEEGIQDHLPRRIGLVEQDNNVVALPELPPEVVATGYRSIGKGPTGTVRGFESKLKTMGDGKGLDGFHGPLRDAAASHVSGKFEWEIDTEWLKARLRRAIDKAPKNAGRGQGIRRYKSDAYLDDIISSAMAKFCQIITHPTY